MMKQSACFALCLTMIFTSCTKTMDNVHFHGRITLDCNNHQPVAGATIGIHRYYDRGVNDANDVGTAVTDNDGFYSLITDVKQNGNFQHYSIFIDAPGITGAADSYNNSNDVEINYEHQAQRTYRFHIKNNSPFDANDVFNYLIVSWKDYYQNNIDTIAANLSGTIVDTTINFKMMYQITCTYSFTKNSILTITRDSTISNPNCTDTTMINVFY